MRLRAFFAGDDGNAVRRGERRVPWPDEESASRIGGELGRELIG